MALYRLPVNGDNSCRYSSGFSPDSLTSDGIQPSDCLISVQKYKIPTYLPNKKEKLYHFDAHFFAELEAEFLELELLDLAGAREGELLYEEDILGNLIA